MDTYKYVYIERSHTSENTRLDY